MKKYKFTALLLTLIMLFQAFPVMADSTDDMTVYPSDDTYIVGSSRWEDKNYGSAATMLFGSAYDRTALIKFDLSSIDLSPYKGALLNITFSAAAESGKIDVYTVDGDWSEDKVTYSNFNGDYSFVVSSDVVQGAEQRLSLTLNRALQKAKDSQSKFLTIALKSRSGCISVFSSENSDKSLRPSVTFMEDSAYIGGQYDFQYPEITQSQLKTEMQKTVAKGHPYLLANKDLVDKVKENAFGKDANLTELYSYVKDEADRLLNVEIHNIDTELAENKSYIGKADNSWKDVTVLGLAYLVEGDNRYAERAYRQAEYLCGLESWGKYQLIDTCRLSFCVALCYDWLYDWLSDDQKQLLTDGVRKHYLNMVSDVHHNPTKEEYKWSFHQVLFNTSGNHNIMDSSLAFLSAMAFAENDMDFMTDIMARTLPYFLSCVSGLYPDGIWDEGPSYWGFATTFPARFIQALKCAFGHCFELDKIDFLTKLADYNLYTTSNNGQFNVGDCHFSATRNSIGGYEPTYYIMGLVADDIDLQSYAIMQAKSQKSVEPLTVLMYDTTKSYDGELSLKLDNLMRGTMYQAVMRSSFEGTQNTFVGMNAMESGAIIANSNDNGTLAFDALGERWITNKSRENYYKGYTSSIERFTWYRARTEAQSCIVIDPSEGPGQDFFTNNIGIGTFESKTGGAYAIADLIKPYSTWADAYSRGIRLDDNRKVFVVQDELDLKKPSEVYSFFNIYEPSEIELLSDGKSAILHKNNKKVYVSIDCDKEFTLGTMYAEPLPTSALPDASKPNTPNPDFMKLYIHFDKIESANIRVCFIPYLCEEELSAVTCKEFVPMSEWTIAEEMKKAPLLEDIKIDGKSLEGFTPYNRCYEMSENIDASKVTALCDNSRYDVKVRNDDKTGAVTILLTDKSDPSNMNSYMLSRPVVPEPSFVDTTGMSVLNITKTVAPEPQAENSIANLYDGNLSTRWSAQQAGTAMMITLDKPKKLGCIAVAIVNDDGRRQSFDVAVSSDGKTYTHVGRFISSGVTPEMEYYDLKNTEAQYVKITWNASTTSTWNSVTELRLYGK